MSEQTQVMIEADPASRTTVDPGQTSASEKRRTRSAALKELLQPIRSRLVVGRVLAATSGILAIAPYIALVHLGSVLLTAYTAGVAPDPDRVDTIVRLLIVSFIVQLATYFVALLVTHFADLKLSRILRDRMIDHIAQAPLAWFSSATSGRIRKTIQDDTKTVHTLVAHAPVETTAATVTPLALAVYAFVIDWRLGLLSIATLPIYLGVQMTLMRGMGEKTAEMDERLGRVSSTAVEFADGISVVKAFGQVGRAHERFARAAREFADFYYAWAGPMLRGAAISRSFISVPIVVLVNIGIGAMLVNAGYIQPVELLTTTLIALVIPGTVEIVSTSAWSYQLAGGAALRIRDSLTSPSLPETHHRRRPVSNRVEFDEVAFSHGDVRALDGVSAVLEPGTVTALVGQSGSGKSTMATMLARFQDPDEGSVRIGGVDLREISSADLYRTVSFVLQDPQLVRTTLRDNIRLARPHADDEEVLAAARAAHIDTDVLALPKGLDTVYDENTSFSVGQAQRVAIARALLADTPILVLDEALTATDADAETEIQAALNRLVTGRTVLVIAHRPEAVVGVDQVICLDQGRIVERLVGDEVSTASVHRIMQSEGFHV